jgi:hypothetical protein
MRRFIKPAYVRFYATDIQQALRDPNVFIVRKSGDPSRQNIMLKNHKTGEVLSFDNVNVGHELLKFDVVEEILYTQPLEKTQMDLHYKLVDNIQNPNGSFTLVYENKYGQKQIYENVFNF